MTNDQQPVSDSRQTPLPITDRESTSECFPVSHSASVGHEEADGRAPEASTRGRQLSDASPEGIFSKVLGLDLGFSVTGFAVCDTENAQILAWGEMDHRNRTELGGVPERMAKRSELRRSRRSRLRHRPPRFDNRERGPYWMNPTMKSHVAAHLKLIRFLLKSHDIDNVVVEAGQFDMHAMKEGRSVLPNWAYQKGELYEQENMKSYVRDRDNYTCQYCGSTTGVMTVDHILPQSRYPGLRRDTSNMVCACEECNREKGNQTAEEYGYPEMHENVRTLDRRHLRSATGMNHLNRALLDHLRSGQLYLDANDTIDYEFRPEITTTYGFITKTDRQSLGWPKAHYYDAAAIASSGCAVRLPPQYMAMRWMGRPVRQKNKTQKQKGGHLPSRVKREEVTVNGTTFRRGDYVEYSRPGKTERGFIQSLMAGQKAKVCGIEGGSNVRGTWTLKRMRKLADNPRLRYELRPIGE